MSGPTARGLLAAGIAAGALAVGIALPRPLSEPAWAPPEEGAPDAPSLPGWRAFVDRQLRTRAAGLDAGGRARLADAILEEAERARLDPVLVLAIIEIESGWDLDAESTRGARGLMQLRPATLRREAARSGLFGDGFDDPTLNVRAGVRYYRRLLDAFRREETALMAYNAGPARIRGYLREGEVPERFRAYPRRVREEVARLKRAFGAAVGPAVAVSD
ncbi:MAG TPA: lytic transglycosylase domain-containing protein [Anaeromyxobacteraceae bacterium]|nr:lytic transglycosylase domain-containing protein [Anaeromyxobacteraceae bacterium]